MKNIINRRASKKVTSSFRYKNGPVRRNSFADINKKEAKVKAKICFTKIFGKSSTGWLTDFRYNKFTVTPYEEKAKIFTKTMQGMEKFRETFSVDYGAKIIFMNEEDSNVY